MGTRRTLAAAFVLTLVLLSASVAVVAAHDEQKRHGHQDDTQSHEHDDDCDDDHDAENETGDHEDGCGDGGHDDDANETDDGGGHDDNETGDDDGDDGGSVSPSIALILSASSIEDGSSVVASWTVSGFTLDAAAMGGAAVSGRGHVHVLVDGTLVEMTAGTSLSLDGLSTGTHTVRVELRNNDHTALSPAVFDEASLDVTPKATAPTPSASAGMDATFVFLGLAILIAILAGIGTIAMQRRRKKRGL